MRVVTIIAVVTVTYALFFATGTALKIVDDDWAGADHSSIQDAIDASSPGETIIVHDGEYSEDLNIDMPVTMTGNGTSTVINAIFTAVIADGNLTISGFNLVGTNGMDIGSNSSVTDVVIEVTGSGTCLLADRWCDIANVSLSGGTASIGSDCTIGSSLFDDVDIELGGNGTTITTSEIIDSNVSVHSDGNLIYDNIFGGTSVDDPGINSWNVTPTSGENVIGGDLLGGNFWYEYDGTDNDTDGIGDSPHELDADTSDGAPLMYLPSPPTIVGAGIAPLNGTSSTPVNFTLTYVDVNNDGPEYVRAVSDALTLNLTPANGEEPRNGTLFAAQQQLQIANYTFHYEVSDGTTEVQSGDFDVRIINVLPELTGSRHPDTGTVDTVFNFTVGVRDEDGDVPTTVKIELDGEEYPMLQVGGGSPVTGLNYSIELTLERGMYQYRFIVIDPHGGQNTTPNSSFEVLNTPPEILDIDVTNEAGVQRFTLSVRDVDGDEPEYARLMVDSEPEPMALTNSVDDTYEYQKRVYIEEGYHEYYVQVSDDIAVDVSDIEPLNLTGFPALKAPGIAPEQPRSEQAVVLKVVYQDREGRPPSYIRVCLDGVDHPMTLTEGGFTSGAVYSYSERLARGTHTYRFNASNGEYFNITKNLTFDVLNTPPQGELEITPTPPVPDGNVTVALAYSDIDGDDPARVRVLLDGELQSSDKEDLGGGNWSITSETVVEHGTHIVEVMYSDGTENLTIRRWLPADTPPEFQAEVHNRIGGENVTINVTASDIDDDPLEVVLMHEGSTYPFSQTDDDDNSTIDGMNYTLTMAFPEGNNTFDVHVNDTILGISSQYVIDIFLKDNRPPDLSTLAHTVSEEEDQISTTSPITFHVVYSDPDPEADVVPMVKLVIVQGDTFEQNLMKPAGPNPHNSRYEVNRFLPEGRWEYHVVAEDGWGGKAVTDNRTITVLGQEPEPSPVDEGSADYGAFQGVLDLLSDTTVLLALMAVIIGVFAAAGAASRARSRSRTAGDGTDERPDGPPPGYGPAPWDETRAGHDGEPDAPSPYGPYEGYDRGPPREVEFVPDTVEFSPGSPPPQEVDDEDDMEWHRPTPSPNAGPFVPSLGGTDDLDEYQPRHDDEWEALMESTGFDGAPARAPSREGPEAWKSEDDWGAGDGWQQTSMEETSTGAGSGPSGEDQGEFQGDGWQDDGWDRDQWEGTGADDGWGDDPFSRDGAFIDDHGDTEVRHFDGEGTRRRGKGKERPHMGMFDDIEEVDVSDWD